MHTRAAAVVLVVEDEPLVMIDAVQSFEANGFEVVEASDAEHALASLAHRPDIRALFTDVNMPGRLDGLALAGVVHANWPDVCVIVTSGGVQVRSDDLPEGSRFIPKPYDGEQVAALMKRILK